MLDPVDPGWSAAELVGWWRGQGRPFRAGGAGSYVWSDGDGEPVLCLHGVPASAFLYRKVLIELAAHGMRGVAIDLPGLGLAERPRDFDYSWSGLGRWCLDACEALELERFHLVVHDIGGPAGFELARLAPERIASLTVLNTVVRTHGFRRPWPMAPFAVPGLGEVWLASLVKPLFRALMRLVGVASEVPDAELDAYVELLKRVDGGRAFLRIMRGFELDAGFEAGVLGTLRALGCPAQVLWGDRDALLDVAVHGEAARAALGCERVELIAGKHFVPEDAPTEIARRVAVLAGVDPS